MSSDRAVRAARRARRSSLPARVISGASLDVSLALESDDDDFFGDDFESDAESVAALSPAGKRPCIANTWSDSADSNSGCEGDDVSSDSDNSSAEAVATPPSTDDQILAKMNAGCGCQKITSLLSRLRATKVSDSSLLERLCSTVTHIY